MPSYEAPKKYTSTSTSSSSSLNQPSTSYTPTTTYVPTVTSPKGENTFKKKQNPYVMDNTPAEKPYETINKMTESRSISKPTNQQEMTIKKSDFQIGKKMGKGQFG